jgi:hypothetical protein
MDEPEVDGDESAAVNVWIIVNKHSTRANAHFMAQGSYTREAGGEGGRSPMRSGAGPKKSYTIFALSEHFTPDHCKICDTS